MRYDRDNLESEYLCPYCGEILYVQHSTPPTDVCLNQGCKLWPSQIIAIVDPTETGEPRIYQELQLIENVLLEEIAAWNPDALSRYAYEARRELITKFMVNGVMLFLDYWFAIGELLLLINKHQPNGSINDPDEFRRLLEKTKKWSHYQFNLEDLRTKRYALSKTKSGLIGFSIKYAEAVQKNSQNLGFINLKNPVPIGELFPYDHIEAEAIPSIELNNISDWADYLATFWPLSMQIKYFLRSHYRSTRQYDYRPDTLDFTVFLGWWLNTWGKNKIDQIHTIPKEKEIKEIVRIQEHFNEMTQRRHSAEEFFTRYVDSTELIPICVRTQDGIIMDYYTLFFFIIYLQGCSDPEEPAIGKREPMIDEIRKKMAKKYEDWLRIEVHKKGFRGPDSVVKIGKDEYEYDIMAIFEKKRLIIIADAKYRDMPPSSFTGENLLKQEFLDEHALKYEAERQELRLDYFKRNLERFRIYLEPLHPWEEYEIHSYLVTKQIPLAHRYGETKIVRALEFLSKEI